MHITRRFSTFPVLSALLATLLLAIFVLAPGSRAQDVPSFREVSGKVVDAHHQPVKGAVVKIENEASEAIMSYVTDADGYFHFKHVSANDDFKVWASLNGMSTKKHELSKFNSKEAPFLTLELP